MLHEWNRRLREWARGQNRTSKGAPGATARPQVEPLEDRCVPAVSLLKDLNLSTTDSSFPANLVEMNGSAYFSATNGNVTGLFKSDGSSGGTTLVKEFSGDVFGMVKAGSTLYL